MCSRFTVSQFANTISKTISFCSLPSPSIPQYFILFICSLFKTEKTKEISLKIVVFPEALIPKKLSILFVYSLLAFEEESLNIPSVSFEVVLCVLIKLISHFPSHSGRPSADIFKTLITDYQLLSILL